MVAPGKHKKKLQPQTVDVCFLSHHSSGQSHGCLLQQPVYAQENCKASPRIPFQNEASIKEGFIYNNVKSGQVNIIYVPTTDNLADFLTKFIPAIKLHGKKIKLNIIIHD